MMIHRRKGGAMRGFKWASLAAAALLTLSSATACSQIGRIQAARSFRAANQAYTQQDYPEAATLYEQTLTDYPDLVHAHFFLANSYDQQFRSTRRGEAENDMLLDKAVQHYTAAADALAGSEDPEDRKLGMLSLQYLAAVYSPDKLNDPAKAEPVLHRMIELEPNEPTNYFQLARLYEDAGAYEDAERILQMVREIRPDDSNVYVQLAAFYNRLGDFPKTIEALQQRSQREPDNPEAFYTIAVYHWDNASRNFALTEDQKRESVQAGLQAVNRALEIRPDYVDALVYKGLLLRQQALLVSYDEAQQLIKEAEALSAQAEEIRQKQRAGAGTAPAAQ
jgi:tetratricopeptide (TPR) repeat protein